MPTTTLANDLVITGGLTVAGALTRTFFNATATAGAATVTGTVGKITTEALTTAQNAIYTLTLTDTAIAAADAVFASVANGTNSAGSPVVTRVQPAAGSVVILIANLHASAVAFNGTLVISYLVKKASA